MSSAAITYGQFARLAKAKGWSPAYLAERFRGKIETPSEFFHRVLDTRNAGIAIAYQSVIQFYFENVGPAAGVSERKTCACGCDRPLTGRKKLATGYCRVKMARHRSATRKSGVQKAQDGAPETFSVGDGRTVGMITVTREN